MGADCQSGSRTISNEMTSAKKCDGQCKPHREPRKAKRCFVALYRRRSTGKTWQHSPPGERPNLHALLSAVLAAAYLSIPTGAEFIKALMRGIRAAASTEAAEPLGSVV